MIDRSLGGEVSHDGDFMIFEGNRYSRKGFLFKSFAMSAVVRRTFQLIEPIDLDPTYLLIMLVWNLKDLLMLLHKPKTLQCIEEPFLFFKEFGHPDDNFCCHDNFLQLFI